VFDDYRLIDPSQFELENRRTRVSPGDVLLTIVGTIGRSAVVPVGLQEFTLQRSVAVLTPNAAIQSEFLSSYFHSPTVQDWFSSNAKGTAQKGVYLGMLSELPVPVPPFDEQGRIVEKTGGLLTHTTRARAELARVPILTTRYKQRLLALAFSGELTASWRHAQGFEDPVEVELSSVATGFSYGSSAKSAAKGEVPVLRMGNIQDGKLDWRNLVFTSDRAEIDKFKLVAGDVLFNRTNSPELVGKTALYRGEQPAIYAGYLIRIQCTDRLMPEFLTYCLNGPAGRAYCWQVKTDGVSQSNINAKKIAAFRFLLPSREEQAEIVRRIDSAFDWLDRVAADHANSTMLMSKLDGAILAKAFRGELVPQDPKDEPASALLERARPGKGEPRGRARRTTTNNSKDSLMAETRLQPSERIQRDSENWPASGLSVADVMSRNPLPHDDLRDALFDLLSGPAPRLRQEFDPVTETMMIKRVAA
jgi:type I restriction enzyme S subunit